MLDAMIRRAAVFISDIGLVVLHAISLLKTLWFVLALAAIFIYWAVFVYKAAPPPLPPVGPGQYMPPTGPVSPSGNATVPLPTAPSGGLAAPPIVLGPKNTPTAPASVIQSVPTPSITGVTPPASLPAPLPEAPAGLVRRYRPPLAPSPYRPE